MSSKAEVQRELDELNSAVVQLAKSVGDNLTSFQKQQMLQYAVSRDIDNKPHKL